MNKIEEDIRRHTRQVISVMRGFMIVLDEVDNRLSYDGLTAVEKDALEFELIKNITASSRLLYELKIWGLGKWKNCD